MTQQRTILRSGAAGLALSLSLGWTTPASAFLDTEGAWNDVLQFAVRQINAPGEFEIELGRVTRPEDGFARIETLSLKDGDGEWVNAKGIVIDWRVRSLLRARFNFQTLSAEEINVIRAPIGRGDPPGDSAQISFDWPRPPTSLTIDKLRIDKLTVSDKLAPQALQARVEGSFSDVGDDQTASLKIARTDGKRGEFQFEGALDFDAGTAKLSLSAAEQAGGLVATAAGLPADQDVELAFTADGGFESLPFQIAGRIGEMGAATGEGAVAFRGLPAITFEGAIAPDERASATWRQALGERSTLSLDARQLQGGGYQLNAFRVESPILEAEGSGQLSPSSDAALNVTWRARDVEAFSKVIAPTRFTALYGEADVTGSLNSPTARIEAVVEGLQGDFGAVERVSLDISAAPPAGASGRGPTDSLFSADIGATGFAPKDPALLEALGADPNLKLTGAWRAAQSVAAIDALTLRARGLQMDGDGAFDVKTKLFDGKLTGVAEQIAPFARLAGIDLTGAADFSLTVEKAGAEGVKGLQLETGLRGLNSSDPNLKAALGEEAAITLDVAESAPGVMRVTRGGLSSGSVAADFSGEISPQQDRVDLAIDWRVTNPEALAGFAPGLGFTAAAGQAAVTGTLSEPQLRTTAQIDRPSFQQYSAEAVTLEAEGQTRKDRRAPFSFDAEIRAPDLGDPALTALAGPNPRLIGRGIHDLATGLLTINELKAQLAVAEAEISGEANLTERTLNLDLAADLPDLNALSPLAPEPLSGSGRLTAQARGSFDAPRIGLNLLAEAPRYGQYGAEKAELEGDVTLRPSGPVGFDLKLALERPALGDASIEQAVGPNPTFALAGAFDPATQKLSFSPLSARAAPGAIAIRGDVDLAGRELDLELDTESLNLARLSPLAGGVEMGGEIRAAISLSGAFDKPLIGVKGGGVDIFYEQYRLSELEVDYGPTPRADGGVPFTATAVLDGVPLDDANLRRALGGKPRIRASGSFNQATGRVVLDSARVIAAVGQIDLKGRVETKAQTLDVTFDADLKDLSLLSGYAGGDLSGAFKGSGSAKGAFAMPSVKFAGEATKLAFDGRGADSVKLTAEAAPQEGGALNFKADLTTRGPKLGDPALEALLGNPALKTEGRFDPSSGVLRLTSAKLTTAMGGADLSGSVNTKAQTLDLRFNADFDNIEPLSQAAGQRLGGALKASGRATGSFAAPRVNLEATGENLVFDTYGLGGLTLTAQTTPSAEGAIPFTVNAEVRRPLLGDPALEALLGNPTLKAEGAFTPSSGVLRLVSANLTTAMGAADLSGSVNTKAQTLDLRFDADLKDLAPLSQAAGETLGGSLKAQGRATGSFTAPRVNFEATGQNLAFAQYGVAGLSLTAETTPDANGAIPFRVSADARGPRFGDPRLEAALGDVKLNLGGAFDPKTGLLRLNPGEVATGAGSARVSGSFGTKDQSLALDFDADLRDLSPFSALAGETLGGSLKASGRVEGTVSAPRVNAKAEGAGLQYGKYGAASLNLTASTAGLSGGAFPFSVTGEVRSPRLGDPQLEALLGDVRLNAQGSFNPESGRLTLEPGELTTSAMGSARVSGFFGTKDQTIGLDFNADLANLAPLSALAGETLGGALKASGRVEGSLSAPRVTASAQGSGLQYAQYGLANLNLNLSSAPQPDGAIPFTLEADANGARLGDPALEALLGAVRVKASGSFNPSTGLLRLEPGEVSTGVGSARVSGSFGTKDQTLGLEFSADIRDLAPFSQLAGQPLGGSLNAAGRVEGSVSAPRVTASAQGRNLQYAQYGLANLQLNLSGAPQADGAISFTAQADARGPRFGDPQLEALLGWAQAKATGSFHPGTGLLRLEPAEVSTGVGSARASGFFGTKDQTLGLDFSADLSNLAPFSQLAGQTLGGAFSASGRVEGSLTAPRVNATARGQNLQYGQYALAGLQLDLSSAPQPDGSLPFSARARLSGARSGDARLDQLLGEATLSAQGSYFPATKQLVLNPAEAQMAAGFLRAAGQVDLANQALAVDVTADLPNLAPLSGFAGSPLAGAAQLSARVEGPFSDPSARGSANLRGFAYDGRPLGDAQAQFNLARLLTAPQGDVSLNAQTPQGPLALSARFASQGGTLQLESFRLDGLGVLGEGRVSVGPGELMEGSARLNASDLRPLGALLGYESQGLLNADVTLSGASGRQTITARGSASNLRLAQNGDFLGGVTSLNFDAQVDDALGADPYVRANFSGQRIEAGGVLLTEGRGALQGPLSNLDVSFDGTGDLLDEGLRELDSFGLQARLNLAGGFKGATVYRLNGRISGEDFNLASALELRQTADGGFGFQNLDLRLGGSGMLGGYLTYAPSGSFGHLVIHNLPLRLLRLAGAPPAEGTLSGEAEMDMRQGTGRFALRSEGMTMIEAGLTSPIQANAEGSWSGAQLTASLTMTSASFSRPLQAQARLTLRPGGGLPTPDMNGPVSAQVSWAGDLGEIWPLLPLPDHLLSGSATLSASLEGSLAAPRTAGGLQIRNGRYEHLEYGTVILGMNADAAFSADGRLTLTAQGGDGYGGQISAMGSYVVASRALDANVRLNRMAAARRDDLTAIVSGEISARGGAEHIDVTGRIDNEFLEFRLIGGGAPNLVVIEATPVGLTAPRTPRRAASASAGSQRINLNLTVNVPGQAYVRGRGLESEWGGQLQVSGHAGAPRVTGLIEKRRGWLDLLGRQFDLEIGEVRFSGDLDPYVTVRLTAEANDIRGWLQVAGYSSDPKISFGSDQGLPEEEVLPRLLFGRSKQSLSAIEAAQLAAGVATLMSGRPGAMDMLRDVAGVDTLRIEEGVDGGTAISTGKYIADGVFVGARQDLGTGGTTALVEIETFNNIVIDAEIGQTETKAGVNWKMDY